eukprot:Em0127g12a
MLPSLRIRLKIKITIDQVDSGYRRAGATPGSGSSSHSTVTAGPGAASSSGPVIVILDNFAGGAMGIAWHGNGIDLEDNWSAGEDEKWNYVRTHLDTERDSTGSPAMFITFLASPPRLLKHHVNWLEK